jgi:hypothetical protein
MQEGNVMRVTHSAHHCAAAPHAKGRAVELTFPHHHDLVGRDSVFTDVAAYHHAVKGHIILDQVRSPRCALLSPCALGKYILIQQHLDAAVLGVKLPS